MNARADIPTEPLIHIGYHKTGTTWLQRRIFNDASLGFTEVWPLDIVERTFAATNPFAFDPEEARASLKPYLDEAAAHGAVPVISHERLSGQPLQGSIDARAIADRLHATFPRARILIGIRNQSGMLISLYKQITTQGLSEWSYDDFLAYRLNDPKLPPVLDVLEYHNLIRYYQGLFGKERVLVLPFETLRDATGFVGRIATLVGIPAPASVPVDRENAALPSGAVAATRLVNVVMRMMGLQRWMTGPAAKPKVVGARLVLLRQLRHVTKGRISARVEERWKEATARYVGDRFAESNAITEQLTDLDLGALGYSVATDRPHG